MFLHKWNSLEQAEPCSCFQEKVRVQTTGLKLGSKQTEKRSSFPWHLILIHLCPQNLEIQATTQGGVGDEDCSREGAWGGQTVGGPACLHHERLGRHKHLESAHNIPPPPPTPMLIKGWLLCSPHLPLSYVLLNLCIFVTFFFLLQRGSQFIHSRKINPYV